MKYLKRCEFSYVVSMFVLLVNLVLPSAQAANQTKTVDVLAIYTPSVAEKYNGNPTPRISHLFTITNKIFEDSNVDLAIRLVHTAEVDYAETGSADLALQDLTYGSHVAFNEVETLRAQYGADMVILYRRWDSSHGGCGVAWIGGYQMEGDFSGYWEKDYAYSHIAIDTCDDFVTAHELGHNLGLSHSRVQDGVGGTFDYALGHGESGSFVTVMAYYSSFNVGQSSGKVYKFSSPDLDCKGMACGVERTASDGADAAYALGISGPQVANYFEAKVHDITASDEGIANDEDLQGQLQSLQSDLVVAQEKLNQAAKLFDEANTEKENFQEIFNQAYEDSLLFETEVGEAFKVLVDFIKIAVAQWSKATVAQRWELFAEYINKYQDYGSKLTESKAATKKANTAAGWLELQNSIVELKQKEAETMKLAVDELNKDLFDLQAASL